MSQAQPPTVDVPVDQPAATIMHVDVDAFFAAVELIDRPDLVGAPMIVGGSTRGVVLSATYEARRFGVRSAMPVSQARALCPQAEVLPPRRHRYVEVSEQVMGILGDVTPRMEQVSIDEAFLDVAGARRRLGAAETIGRQLRTRIRAEARVTASVGIGVTKSIAKLASTLAKPDGLLHVAAAETLSFLHRQPVGALWGVGPKTRERLHRHGIDTVAELAARPVAELHRMLGASAGQHVHDLAHGIDPRGVHPEREAKSIGTETTFAVDVRDRETLEVVLLEQSHACARRLRLAGALSRTVSIKVRFSDFRTVTRSRAVAATDVAHSIHAAAKDLLGALTIPAGGVRLIGVRTESLVPAADLGVQLTFEGTSRRDAEAAMDEVQRRFGSGAIAPASLLRGEPGDGG